MTTYKILSLLILLITVYGCGGGGNSNSNNDLPSQTPTTPSSPVDEDTTGNESSGTDDTGNDDTGNDDIVDDNTGNETNVDDDTNTGNDSTSGDENTNTAIQPNILLIISDDQGLDASAQYTHASDVPNTPNLNQLATNGITFENMWATPACSTTRATMITGKYGINNGVTSVPGNLSSEHEIIQQYLKNNESTENYASAVFGKWHIGVGASDTHPNDLGIEHYAGNLQNVSDYYNWQLTINGNTETNEQYHTTAVTDLTLSWINQQTNPWFAWVAYSAPHTPFHLPPQDLHNRDLLGTEEDIDNFRREYYLAAIEAMDAEIGRLLNTMPAETRENTIVLFIGDNGTPAGVIDESVYSKAQSKGSLYQGGIAVPFVVSGKGVTRQNARETALVTATDLYATIGQLAGIPTTNVYDSQSFAPLLSSEEAHIQDYIYTEYESEDTSGWAVRSHSHKLIQYEDGTQELFALTNNLEGSDNLIDNNESSTERQTLSNFAGLIVGDDPNASSPLDITNAILNNTSKNCADYVEKYTSTVNDVNNGAIFYGDLQIAIVGDKCIFNTNAIPNHDFNDGGNAFPNDVSEQNDQFEVTTNPTQNTETTDLSLRVDNAIMLNGVKVDLLAAGCFGIGNGKVGCNDMSTPWRYDPMHAANGFNVDSHSAHAQGDGTYHYHGSPMALFSDDNGQASPVVGFAADGFPIYGSYFDDNGVIRKALPSYRLKAGNRPTGDGQPGGIYDGAFRDDYEYVDNLGDLDECNGMTINGAYAYFITDNYPYVLACFRGTPDASFNK